jgi:hypothetical protein
VESGDAAATFQNVADASGLLRVAIAGFIVAFALDVLVAWLLYHVFRPGGPTMSWLAAWFRVVYTVFLGVAVIFLFAVLELTSGDSAVSSLDQATREADTMLALDAFNATWLVGLTCFGIHLALLGSMALRTNVAPRVLGIFLQAAGAMYVFDTFAYTLLSSYEDHEALFTTMVAAPAVIAEASLAVWLIRTGRCAPSSTSQTTSAAGNDASAMSRPRVPEPGDGSLRELDDPWLVTKSPADPCCPRYGVEIDAIAVVSSKMSIVSGKGPS